MDQDPILQARRKKVDDLKAKGLNPYRIAIRPEHLSQPLHDRFGKFSKEELETQAEAKGSFSVAGRILLYRSFGKSTFLTIRDRKGRIQLFCQQGKLGDAYDLVKAADLGDIVFARGSIFKTKTGELSIDCTEIVPLTKNTRPLPEKFHGLQDIEARYRQRYLDLISHDEVIQNFKIRAQVIQGIRSFFLKRDYMEVETPMLHPLVGGATARPFKTFHNTLKMNLFLRIAPELYLKRLVVGGLDRVFEINRCFRNEGISIKHNPEFTMLEFYEAYATYEDLMNLTEELLEALAQEVLGSTEIQYQEHKISLKRPFKRWTVVQSLKEMTQLPIEDHGALLKFLKSRGIQPKGEKSLAELQWICFEEEVESLLIQPTYIMDHPVEVSPLARRSETKVNTAERFELYIGGREIANGFNELNDPEDQKGRFQEQLNRKAAGDEEASDFDEDYIHALEFGLPPTAGEGIGIDRLTMLFTNSPSIRDVIFFPQLKNTHES